MKKLLLFIFTFSTIFGFSQATSIENPFSKEFFPTKTENHVRIEGTKIFANIPSDYVYNRNKKVFEKSKTQYIRFVEIRASFVESQNKLNTKALEERVSILEKTKYGGYDAIYTEGVNPFSNDNDLILAFGDDDFVVSIVGKTDKEKPEDREELIQIMKTAYYDKSYLLNELDASSFLFDINITKFKHAGSNANMILYAEKGKEDEHNTMANSILVGNLPKMSKENLKIYSTAKMEHNKNLGIEILTKKVKEKKIGDYDALVLDSKIECQGKKGIIYQLVLTNGNESMVFIGTAYEDIKNFRKKFIKTAKTIKFK